MINKYILINTLREHFISQGEKKANLIENTLKIHLKGLSSFTTISIFINCRHVHVLVHKDHNIFWYGEVKSVEEKLLNNIFCCENLLVNFSVKGNGMVTTWSRQLLMRQGKVCIPTMQVGVGVQAAEAMTSEGNISPAAEEKPLQWTTECKKSESKHGQQGKEHRPELVSEGEACVEISLGRYLYLLHYLYQWPVSTSRVISPGVQWEGTWPLSYSIFCGRGKRIRTSSCA